jgi:hypothetical protein
MDEKEHVLLKKYAIALGYNDADAEYAERLNKALETLLKPE